MLLSQCLHQANMFSGEQTQKWTPAHFIHNLSKNNRWMENITSCKQFATSNNWGNKAHVSNNITKWNPITHNFFLLMRHEFNKTSYDTLQGMDDCINSSQLGWVNKISEIVEAQLSIIKVKSRISHYASESALKLKHGSKAHFLFLKYRTKLFVCFIF